MWRRLWHAPAVHGISRMSGADSLLRYAALPRYGEIYAKMDHLVCFVPAMLALGVHAHAVADQKAAKYLDLAEELGRTCWQMYAQMPSGAHGPAAAVTCDSGVAWVACVRCMAPCWMHVRALPTRKGLLAITMWASATSKLTYSLTMCNTTRLGARLCCLLRAWPAAWDWRGAQCAATRDF